MNGFLIPVFTFFSRPFYKSVSRDASNKGFLYLLYLGVLFTLAVQVLITTSLTPKMNEAVRWIKKEMPVLTFTKEGLSMDKPSPYSMIYPGTGALVTFDVSKDTATPQEIGNVPIYFTKANMYVSEKNGESRIYSFRDASVKSKNMEKDSVTINAPMVDKFYASIKPALTGTVLFVGFIGFFVWKVLTALLYSLPATTFNSMRAQKLSYGKLLDLTVYALTPATIFQMARMLIPGFGKIPFLFVLDISITLAYLYFAVKMSEQDSNAPIPGNGAAIS